MGRYVTTDNEIQCDQCGEPCRYSAAAQAMLCRSCEQLLVWHVRAGPLLPLIRAMNPCAFRAGYWAKITGVRVVMPELATDKARRPLGPGRVCYEVEFIDGAKDLWPVEDAAAHEYEFRPSIHDPHP